MTAWDIWGTAGAKGGRPLSLGIGKDARARGAGLRVWASIRMPGLEGPTSPPALPRGGPSGPRAPGRGGRGEGEECAAAAAGGRAPGGAEIFFFPSESF